MHTRYNKTVEVWKDIESIFNLHCCSSASLSTRFVDVIGDLVDPRVTSTCSSPTCLPRRRLYSHFCSNRYWYVSVSKYVKHFCSNITLRKFKIMLYIKFYSLIINSYYDLNYSYLLITFIYYFNLFGNVQHIDCRD